MSIHTRLLQFTDCHLLGDSSSTLRGTNTWQTLQATLAHASTHQAPWDITLLTGDLVQDDVLGYRHIRRTFETSQVPVHCLPGNHDDLKGMSQQLSAAPFHLLGSFCRENWLVVMLNSCLAHTAAGSISRAELARLADLLHTTHHEHALIALHHHPVPMSSQWLDEVGIDNSEAFFAVLDAAPSVRGVVWGHVHQAFDGERHGVRLMGTPSTCAQFTPRVDDFAIDSKPPGYRWLHLHEEGALDSQVEWVF